MKEYMKWIFGVMVFCIIIFIFRFTCSFSEVAHQEFNGKELLRKYEWFKDASAQLDSKKNQIQLYKTKIEAYKIIKNPSRTDNDNFLLWQQELIGIQSSYLNLKAEYNSQMAKVNWRFCNVGDLPEGETITLPRNYE